MSSPGTILGGVLSDQAIFDRVQSDELIVKSTFTADSLAPSSYEPRIARDGLITPNGTPFPPGSSGPAKVILRSGDTAMFSTIELFHMPPDVAGNITVKNRLAKDGLMLLSGLLIDPGFGADEKLLDDQELGCRLYLHVANIGREPIIIQPERAPITRIQFLCVCGGRYAQRQKIRSSRWADQEPATLGFLTELQTLKVGLTELKDKVDSTHSQVHYVVMLGAVVLGVTLIGVVLATVLALVSK